MSGPLLLRRTAPNCSNICYTWSVILGLGVSPMRRRDFIALVSSSVAGWPLAARAQQPRMPVVGHLNVASAMPYSHLLATFRDSLKRAGWAEGINVAFEYRWADGQYERLAMLAADLVRRQVTVIVASGGNAPAQAAKAATDMIPIVFISGGEPVRGGLVASMNRPGANVTGVSTMFSALVPKRLDLLKQLVPTITVIGALINPKYPDADLQRHELDDAAAAIGQQVRLMEASSESAIEAAFASFANSRVDALIAMNDPFFQSVHNQITALAAHYALPTIYWDREFVAGGGLVKLWSKPDGCVSPGRHLRGPRSPGREARRSSRAAANQVRVGYQSQNCEGAQPADSGQTAHACRRGDRVSNCVVGSGGSWLPCSTIAEHSVEGCDHFSHDGDDDDLGFFVGGGEAFVEGFEGGTVTACAEGGHVEDVTDRHPTTIDATVSLELAAIEVIWCEADEGGDLFAAHLPEFRQQGDECEGQHRADAWHGGQQVIALSESHPMTSIAASSRDTAAAS